MAFTKDSTKKKVIDRFDINLDHDIDEQYQYVPGEALRGHILLVLTDTIKVKSITVQIKGEASVSWEDSSRETVRADEVYIDLTYDVTKTTPGIPLALQKGKHKFPLEYVLPLNLPSSFIGKYGSITYVVKATLKEDKQMGMSTTITSEPFLVLRHLDINSEESLSKQKTIKQEKRFFGTFAFCINGKVSATIGINKTGHFPGEDIYINAHIANNSPRDVRGVQAALVMNSRFNAKHQHQTNVQVVNKRRDEWSLEAGEARKWTNVRLTIPPYIPESRLDGCDIIDISYDLQFIVDIASSKGIIMKVPIVIGTGHTPPSPEILSASGVPNAQEYIPNGKTHSTVDPLDLTRIPEDKKSNRVSTSFVHDVSDVNANLEEEDDKGKEFRRPMVPGETRQNPLYSAAEN
ncbi:DgyrCDS4754 [Dimorphilus gyrociliatus]|uniref:DgyrCDS4754 n=1 Tax=Dimorphilus gyrociliatus TaxID=2664684 RepID=A0A7I8VKJ6_9ANNE|nr:DgyrCDS4754 [Dimorphilus gyrociliatus]